MQTAPRTRPIHRVLRTTCVLLATVLAGACSENARSTVESSLPGGSVPGGSAPGGSAPGGSSVPGRPSNGVPGPTASVPVPTEVIDGFDDHTVSAIASVAEFHALARSGVSGQSAVKFSIPTMATATDVRWMDSNFYSLHDEWYWFRLLNGRSVSGFTTEPVDGPAFETVEEIVEWASRQPGPLPLDLRFIDSRTHGRRLYSDEFYAQGVPSDTRNYGLGSVVLLPDAADGADHWLIELEYTDVPTPAEVDRYFGLLEATLPDAIGSRLEWVIRSPEQEAVAAAMAASELPRHDRIVRFGELIPAGQTAVYNPGIAAGRLLVVDGVNTQLSDATTDDIVIVEQAPDSLPPAAALLTSAPQTPLAHVNLLARNRGIPNASRAGLLDDAGLRQAARVRARAVVRADADGTLEIVLISRAEYDAWRALRANVPISVAAVDRAALPLTVDLTELAATIGDDDDIEAWRPVIGGKSAGFLSLLEAPGVTTPLDPLAITVGPYLEHLDQVDSALTAMLSDADFRSSARARFLFLEGLDDYLEVYPDPADEAFAQTVSGRHEAGTPLADVLAADGFQRYFRDVPMRPATLAAITESLEQNFGDYAPSQGLRFRSSSSVEDIEGFNGAGLYDSNTGFVHADAEGNDPDDTVERAIKKTWASYWSFEAFEERRLESVDHRSGAMGVLAHARFDDDLEIDNGVATFTLLPDGDADRSVAVVNVQAGDLSVTNPDAGGSDLPERVEVRRAADGSITVERLAPSTVTTTGTVMTDDALLELAEQLEATTERWRDWVNASLPEAQRVDTVTLDFEFKTMAPGWPALDGGAQPLPGRLVVKQARSLDPGTRGVPDEVLELPIPRDVLARATDVTITCPAGADGGGWVEVLTDPLLAPDVGYADRPLTIEIDSPDGCVERTLFTTPSHYLVGLLDTGDVLRLG